MIGTYHKIWECVLHQKYYLTLFISRGASKSTFTFTDAESGPELWVGSLMEEVSFGSRMNFSEDGGCLWDASFCQIVLPADIFLLLLQIGNLEDYYHFYHSKTFKRSTLSSRGPHTFLRMDPQVPISIPFPGCFLRA